MILAAGEGTRLRPLTNQLPKALVPLGGVPLVQLILEWLKSYEVCEVAINLHHLGEKIADFCGDGSRFGLKVTYSSEGALLGTAGGVKRMHRFFGKTFVVVYGDILTNFNLKKMIEFHESKGAIVTIAAYQNCHQEGCGVLRLNHQGQVIQFVEKPEIPKKRRGLSNGGVYVLRKEVLNYIPGRSYYDFGFDVFPKLIDLGVPIYGYTLSDEEYLTDIGTWQRMQKANEDIKLGKFQL